MIIFQTALSISSMVLQNCLLNKACKNLLKTNDHIYRFNMIMYALCVCLFGIGIINGHISLFTIALALVFGATTALGNLYKMLALSCGPMHITLLITTSSMIIPTMSGVLFGEQFSIAKLVAVLILIGFIYMSFEKSNDGKISKKWILYILLAFLFQGSIGVLQKIHQSSAHRGELNGFLFVAFICSFLYSRLRAGKTFSELRFTKKHISIAIVCGICAYAMNILNLKLSGLLPSQLFFPVINGSAIVLSSLISVLLFKEKLSKKQSIGLIGGIASLIAICLL